MHKHMHGSEHRLPMWDVQHASPQGSVYADVMIANSKGEDL